MIRIQEKTTISFDGTKLYTKSNMPSKKRAVAVIVHGLCEHQGRYDYLAATFNRAGIATYRFDHRGHGRSEGHKAHINSFHELLDDTNMIVDFVLKENPDFPVFLLGHSMGGFTASLYGAKYPDKKLKGIITSGALVKDDRGLISSVPSGLDALTPIPNELDGGVCSVKEVVEDYIKDPYNGKTFTAGLCYSIIKGVEWYKENIKHFNHPALILHGEKDSIVSENDSIFLFKNISSKDKQIKIYGNLFHEIYNEYSKDEVLYDTLSWIVRRI